MVNMPHIKTRTETGQARVIAVDFDGTLCTNKWPKIGEPRTEIIQRLKYRKGFGDRIILWTCRQGDLLQDALSWCAGQGLRFDAVNDNIPERVAQYGSNPRKVSADEYWDDRAVKV